MDNTMDKLTAFKNVTAFVAASGAAIIVNCAIKAVVSPNINPIAKIAVFVGGFALSGLVARAVDKHTHAVIDEIVTDMKFPRNTTALFTA